MMGLFQSIGKGLAKTLDQLSGVVTNPLTAITKGISAAEKQYVEASKVSNITKVITNTALAAGAAVGIGAVASGGTAAIATGAKALIPSTAKGKIIAAVAAPIAIGAVVQAPVQTAKAVASAPSELAEFGGGIAKLITQPSVESAKELFEDSPILTTLTGAALVGGAAKSILPAIATTRQTAAINEQTEALKSITGGVSGILPVEKEAVVGSTKPITPPTETISAGVKRKPSRKRLKAPVSPNISQRVNIMVSNKNSSVGIRQSKKYLNREVLLN